MANVNPVEGIVYGFRLLAYFLVVGIIGAVIAGIGYLSGEGIMMVVFGLLGYIFIMGGLLGAQYKLIADAVEKGLLAAK
ncbi:conserved hypothetical protein [Halorhabdus utahensis DSM 12940]|uniref:DUF4282 domain-containing protein n=1 Tax=Halorhabdus utahensis (strain DSM 12940 / JCM 11049 / AX-2) TaxID=519442 RepID=C7NQ39_HALUD|nr:hypothetical protein [Halorhabdus utahensis]ACV11783.1 conserved hypothetical protein [Halorhabdus utahensis DSM 12940]